MSSAPSGRARKALWTVEAERADTGETVTLTCGFLFMNSGYYRYDQGYTPEFPGLDRFAGEVVHPQHWPEDLDYAGKRVVVIGSGATAMTLVPAMAEDAAKVTMLQRSPTYVISMPGEDGFANFLRRHLPDRAAYPIVRWKNVIAQGIFYRLSRKRPELIKKVLRRGVVKSLPPGYDVDTHFKPRYNPWDQRVCLVPDADLFRVLARRQRRDRHRPDRGLHRGRDRARVRGEAGGRRRHHRDRPQPALPRRHEDHGRRRGARHGRGR